MNKPLCFVLMPFGNKTDASGNKIDFDEVYRKIIALAISKAGLEPLRADEELMSGIIHKPMFERLILCEYAVADLTTANANVFYELGLRHAVRPWSTVLIFAEGNRLPFDVTMLRGFPYKLNKNGKPAKAKNDSESLAKILIESRNSATQTPTPPVDSPVFQLVEHYPDIARLKTDIFRDYVKTSEIKNRLTKARKQGVEAVRKIEAELGDLKNQESGVVIDLFLSYRATEGWKEMIALVDKMSRPLAATAMVQEQLALALNRDKRGDEAEKVLKHLLELHGAGSETLGILGRVYKDRWEKAVKDGKKIMAKALLDKSIEAYLRGFEADWRDAYPGINAVTLMEIKEPPDPRREKILPVVRYAAEQRVAKGKPDYWDYATLLEAAVLAKNEEEAIDFAGKAVASVREIWEPKTTVRNLRLIREARERRGEESDWMKEIEEALAEKTTL